MTKLFYDQNFCKMRAREREREREKVVMKLRTSSKNKLKLKNILFCDFCYLFIYQFIFKVAFLFFVSLEQHNETII